MIFDMPECGGCRTCELACSFHHLKEFKPAVSSIKILDKEDKKGFNVLFVDESGGIPCDACVGCETSLCLDYCEQSEELKKMIKAFSENRRNIQTSN